MNINNNDYNDENNNENSNITTILFTSKRKLSLLLIVLGAIANLGEVLFTSHVEYYCSSKLKSIILLPTNNDDYDDDDYGTSNSYYYYYYYYDNSNNQTSNTFQCTVNNCNQGVNSKCYCQSKYCEICNTCGNFCYSSETCSKSSSSSSSSSSSNALIPTSQPTLQCFKEIDSTSSNALVVPTYHPTKGPKQKVSSLKAKCDPEIDFTKRPFLVVIIFTIMDCIKQFLLSKFQYARTWKGRIIYLILHIIMEIFEACILFLTATIYCLQTCPGGLPNYGGYKGILIIYLIITLIQIACGPLREYFNHFEKPEIRLPSYLIMRKLAMTFISDLTVGIFSFNSHKVFATDWFRYLIFIYIWIIIAGIEMIIGIKEILFDSFKSKLQATRCHVYYLYTTYFSWGWFIWLLSFFTIPYINSCISINKQHRELGENCSYKNPYWLIILIWINVIFFSLYYRYTLIITNFIEEQYRCTKGHKCKVINQEMFSNISGISIKDQNQKCNHCDHNVPLYNGFFSIRLHKYVFEYCKKCNYFCCMNCAYKQRHSQYYLYGLLWRKSNSLPDIIDTDNDDDDEIIIRHSKRISVSNNNNNNNNSSLLNPLQNDNRISLNPLKTDVENITSRL